MARIIRCDQCAREGEPNEFGLPPVGWLIITEQAASFTKPAEACSPACGILILQRKEGQIHAR